MRSFSEWYLNHNVSTFCSFISRYCHSSRWLVGATDPTPPEISGATRPRTPGFTFGRPKVNRKTAKTKVLDSFAQSVCISGESSLPLNFVLFLIYGLVVNDATPAGL